jgi:hypothetical protein
MIKWYLHYHAVWANLLKSYIKYLLSIFRVTALDFRKAFVFIKSMTYPHSKGGPISIAV